MKTITNKVRDVNMQFVGYTRSLELCARMNYETENLDFIDEIPRGSLLVDLGACEGRFAIYAALKGISVHAFEPEARNFQAFTENIALNNLSNEDITPYKIAIGDRAGKARLNIGQPWAGGHQKIIDHAETRDDLKFQFTEFEEVEMATLDELIKVGRVPSPDFLKIDIDGSELSFLAGATESLKSEKLQKIIFELDINDRNFAKIISALESSGLKETSRYQVPNEPTLYNIIFSRRK